MNLHHLRIFGAVAESGSMTAASATLLISQPAISSQLKQLEQSIESPLFVRRARGMELTDAGKILAEYAKRIFALADEAAAAVKDVQSLRRGSLRIGATPIISTYFLPPLLLHFQRRFPQVQLLLETAEIDALEAKVHDGFLDVALGPLAALGPEMDAVPFKQEKFVAVVDRTHPLARRRRVTPEDLAGNFIGRQLPSSTGAMAFGYFAMRQISLKPTLSLGSVEGLKQAVIAGLGATLVSEMAVKAELQSKRLKIIAVDGLPLRRTLYYFSRHGRSSKAAIAFHCLLKHAVRGTLPKLRS